jgi:hypothetical protein
MAKTYLRKQRVADRYATTPRSVERMVDDGRIPPPAFYNGRNPLWDEEALDANDRAATVRSRPNRAERDSTTA